jgi:hypothetical protein
MFDISAQFLMATVGKFFFHGGLKALEDFLKIVLRAEVGVLSANRSCQGESSREGST